MDRRPCSDPCLYIPLDLDYFESTQYLVLNNHLFLNF